MSKVNYKLIRLLLLCLTAIIANKSICYPPTKVIRQSGGFNLGLSYPLNGRPPKINDTESTFEFPTTTQFNFGLFYNSRQKGPFWEYGINFSQSKNYYKLNNEKSDSIIHSLISNYIALEIKLVFHNIGDYSRNLYGLSFSPGVSIKQTNITYYRNMGRLNHFESENYYTKIRKPCLDFGAWFSKEFDFSHDLTFRYEFNLHWNFIVPKSTTIINQFNIGFKGYILFM